MENSMMKHYINVLKNVTILQHGNTYFIKRYVVFIVVIMI